MLKMQTFLCNGDQHIGAHGNPDLRLHGVLAGAQKRLDAQVLLDPFEEQLDLPTLAVQVGNELWLQGKVVGQKGDALAGLVLDYNTSQSGWIVLAGIEHREYADLVADDRGVAAVHGIGIASLELRVALGSRHEEGLGLMNDVQPAEVQIAPIHQVERPDFEHQVVQNIDLVGLAVCDVNEAGDAAMQVQQGVQLDGGLGGAKRCPRMQGQTQVDGAGVERVDRCIQIDSQRLLGVQRSGHANQMLRNVGIDLPGSGSVRIGQCVARNRRAAKPHVVQPIGLGSQVDFDIAQGLAIGQLRECHGEELVQAREVFDLVVAPMFGHTPAKGAHGQIGHELRKNELALMHIGPSRGCAKGHKSDARRSNRDQTGMPNSASKSLTYEALM